MWDTIISASPACSSHQHILEVDLVRWISPGSSGDWDWIRTIIKFRKYQSNGYNFSKCLFYYLQCPFPCLKWKNITLAELPVYWEQKILKIIHVNVRTEGVDITGNGGLVLTRVHRKIFKWNFMELLPLPLLAMVWSNPEIFSDWLTLWDYPLLEMTRI